MFKFVLKVSRRGRPPIAAAAVRRWRTGTTKTTPDYIEIYSDGRRTRFRKRSQRTAPCSRCARLIIPHKTPRTDAFQHPAQGRSFCFRLTASRLWHFQQRLV